MSWVGFWAIYGEGLSGQTVAAVATFGAAYLTVLVVEPVADLAVLAGAKAVGRVKGKARLQPRLFSPA